MLSQNQSGGLSLFNWLYPVILPVCLLTLCLLNADVAARDQPQRPNVIVIMTDDQGYGDFSFNGNPLIKTPAIDRLAANSVRLTDFHVAPMCTPTRGQFITGLDAFRNGAVNVSSGRTLLRPELRTIADEFRSAGYATGIFGKWHLGDNYPFRPSDRGFDESIWFPSSHINSVPDFWDNDYFADTYIHQNQRKTYSGYCTDIFFTEAMEWIDSRSVEQPSFTFIPLNAAHWPLFVPQSYRDRARNQVMANIKKIKKMPPGKLESLISFLAMGLNIDDNIDRLMNFLKETHRDHNTMVVFLTDNGSTFGQDYYNAGMKGKKTQLWEGGHRVPCLIYTPENMQIEPREIDELTHVQDLMPTLLDLAGVSVPHRNLDGISLKPLLLGDQPELPDRMLVINYSRMPGFEVSYTTENPAIPQKDGAAVLWKQWRLLENRELYDVMNDPHQDEDVAARYPDVVEKMSRHLDGWWAGVQEIARKPQRVIIGSEEENPSLLTACEWLDVFVDQQKQIRSADRKNGVWYLTADQSGTYRFELRRWPVETQLKLSDTLPATKVIDGEYLPGEALPITSARLHVAGKEMIAAPAADGQSVSFQSVLPAGEFEMQTWFLDDQQREICGAYYVYVERLK